jgi:hypothetical protein
VPVVAEREREGAYFIRTRKSARKLIFARRIAGLLADEKVKSASRSAALARGGKAHHRP